MSVNQLNTWAASQLHEAPGDAQLTTLLTRWVNEGVQDIVRAGNWKWLEAQEEFTLGGHGAGANTALGVTYFPPRVGRILDLWQGGLGYRRPVIIFGAWETDAMSPPVAAGVADSLTIWGYYNVARDNTTTGVLTVADTGASTVQVRIEGVDNNGFQVYEDVAVGASTAQFALGPDGVRHISVIDSTVVAGTGVVTVTDAGAAQIERINAGLGERMHERLRTEISPPPAAGVANFVVRYYKRIRDVRDTDDVVPIPFEFENLLMQALSRRLALFQGEMDKAMYFEQLFAQGVRKLRAWQNKEPGRMRGLRQLTGYGDRAWGTF